MRRFPWAGRAFAATSLCGLMLQSPITAAAADGPALILDSICTAEEPYAVSARVTDFPPSERFAVLAVLLDSDNRRNRSGTHFETDANGASGVGSVLATEPFDSVAIF